jgi:uncharacterized membrane protein
LYLVQDKNFGEDHMVEVILKWARKNYNKFVHSIAFLPAIMAVGFLMLAVGMMEMDDAGVGLQLNKRFKWLTLKDAETARSIVATVAAGIISLTVFSFSMVMVVINQAASQMSNRMLDNIIGDRVQKVVLGFYIGTIVFALFLLTNISESNSTFGVPTLTVYFLLVLTVFDIFLFVYFLHYITQSFRYEQLIQRIHNRTSQTLDKLDKSHNTDFSKGETIQGQEVLSRESGYYQGFDEKQLMKLAEKNQLQIQMLHPIGTYVLKATPLLILKGNIEDKELSKLLLDIDFYYGQEIDKNAYYGFRHLSEVAVKALSPGINDPGTAILSIEALTDLFARIMKKPIADIIKDAKGRSVIITKQISFYELFESTVFPIWNYGRNDMNVQNSLLRMLNQLTMITELKGYQEFFERFRDEINGQKHKQDVQ